MNENQNARGETGQRVSGHFLKLFFFSPFSCALSWRKYYPGSTILARDVLTSLETLTHPPHGSPALPSPKGPVPTCLASLFLAQGPPGHTRHGSELLAAFFPGLLGLLC